MVFIIRPRKSSFFAFALLSFMLSLISILVLTKLVANSPGDGLAATLVSLMPATAYFGLFAVLFLENTLLPIPGELFLPLAGYYVFAGTLAWMPVVIIGACASVSGSLVIFLLALKFDPSLVYWGATKMGVSQATLAKNEIRLSGKYGSLIVLFSRFLPIYGSSLTISAGGLKMNLWKLFAISLFGSLASMSLYLSIGYWAGPLVQSNEVLAPGFIADNLAYVLAAAVCVYLAYYLLRWWKERRAEAKFIAKLGPEVEEEDPRGAFAK